MAVIVKKVKMFRCNDCEHEWKRRKARGKYEGALPPTCPKCRSRHWNTIRLSNKRRYASNRTATTEQRSGAAL